jgi:hypothetical protein
LCLTGAPFDGGTKLTIAHARALDCKASYKRVYTNPLLPICDDYTCQEVYGKLEGDQARRLSLSSLGAGLAFKKTKSAPGVKRGSSVHVLDRFSPHRREQVALTF